MSGIIGGSPNMRSGVVGQVSGGSKLVWSGWNSTSSAVEGSWDPWPLDAETTAVNTDYMTKSTGTFTCVRAGTYQMSFITMMSANNSYYTHHNMTDSNGSIQTHDYIFNDSANWVHQGYTWIRNLSVSNTILFKTFMQDGDYAWHGGTSYSQLAITYLNP